MIILDGEDKYDIDDLKILSDEEFVDWAKGNSIGKPMFVIIKTQTCSKCKAFIEDYTLSFSFVNTHKEPFPTGIYEFSGKNEEAAKILSDLGVLAVPRIIFGYTDVRDGNKFKLHVIDPEGEEYDLEYIDCLYDAIRDKYMRYFDYDEFDNFKPNGDTIAHGNHNRPWPEEALVYPYMRLIRTIFGEIDSDTKEQRDLLESSTDHLGKVEIRD